MNSKLSKEKDYCLIYDKQKYVDAFVEILRCKTISTQEDFGESDEFDKLRSLIKTLFPLLHEKCTLVRVGSSGLIYHLQGKSAQDSCVLMAHYDVVSADESFWIHPPFDGYVDENEIWGRGTIDTKITFYSALASTEELLQYNFIPENDIYFSFSGDEEVFGPSAPAAVEWLSQHKIKPAFVLDEGGMVLEEPFPGIDKAFALIGTAEKGKLNISISSSGIGGHASTPPQKTLLNKLSDAAGKLQKNPFPARITAPARALFSNIGKYSAPGMRLVFNNSNFFKPIIAMATKKTGGQDSALIRTTCALTMAKGSDAINVLPSSASFHFDIRVLQGDTIKSTVSRIEKVINDKELQIEVLPGSCDPSPISPDEGKGWDAIAEVISSIWPDVVVSPYLMTACTDSRHFCKICDNVYRFSPMRLTLTEFDGVHGHNERISIETLLNSVSFYKKLISRL